MARAVVANGLSERPTSEQIGKPPAEASAILPWFEEGAAALLSALQECDPEAPAWNFTGVDTTMGFWVRRQAHETSIHRWDGQSAAGATTPIPSAVAVDGVDELFMLLGSQLPRVKPDAATDGSLHLHATDAEGEWTLRIDHGQVQVQTGHSKGDAAIRGTASDLNLLVWGRRNPLTEAGYELFGDTAVIERYVAIGAF